AGRRADRADPGEPGAGRPLPGRENRGLDPPESAGQGARGAPRSALGARYSRNMISAEQNELMTRVGPGTPCGKLLRRYWQPVALTDELQRTRPVKAVRIMGEDLVLFRDSGRYGLIERQCAHRGADLAYGRLEDGGLRCSFHGWLYGSDGRCLQTPAEPEGSRLCEHVRLRAYPVLERSVILFAYIGEGEAPA